MKKGGSIKNLVFSQGKDIVFWRSLLNRNGLKGWSTGRETNWITENKRSFLKWTLRVKGYWWYQNQVFLLGNKNTIPKEAKLMERQREYMKQVGKSWMNVFYFSIRMIVWGWRQNRSGSICVKMDIATVKVEVKCRNLCPWVGTYWRNYL